MSSSPRLSYEELLNEVRLLNGTGQLRLLEDLAVLAHRKFQERPGGSILELRGLGKEAWQDLDAGEYVERERASWSG